MTTRFASLAEVIEDRMFPEVDLALRRGRHVDRDDDDWYQFLTDALDFLEPLYRRYGCELVAQSDGYFFLKPTSKPFSVRRLSGGEMLVGQALALQYLEPDTVKSGGIVTHEQLLSRLANLISDEDLANRLNPHKKHSSERVVQETIRTKVSTAIHRLARMGFIVKLDQDSFRLRAPLLRFADPVRGLEVRDQALERLIASGNIAPLDDEDEDEGDNGEEREDEDEA
jgi:chromosome partition protein MukE